MATRLPDHDAGSHGIRSTIKATLFLLSIYVAVFLAVAGIVNVLASHDASAAIAPASLLAPSAANVASCPPFGVAESPPRDSPFQVLERTDNPRECRPSAKIDSDAYSTEAGCSHH